MRRSERWEEKSVGLKLSENCFALRRRLVVLVLVAGCAEDDSDRLPAAGSGEENVYGSTSAMKDTTDCYC